LLKTDYGYLSGEFMTKIFGAQAIVKCLEREGIEVIFGIPGLYNMPIFDALYRHPTIQVITVRHEQGAAFMADGYARATGKPAAIIPLPGPGLTNAMTGIGEAFYDSIPMLILVTQVNRNFIDKEAGLLHEMTSQYEMLAPLTKHGERIHQGDQISDAFLSAMKVLRTGRPRPVQIEIPRDIQAETVEWTSDVDNLLPASPQPSPLADQIDLAVKALNQAERPLIYAGGGTISSGASSELVQLAERLGAPVLTTGMGVGSIPSDHPLACGVAWVAAADIRPLVKASDLFLAVGTRFNDGMTHGWNLPLPSTTIRIDIDAAEIERNIPMEQKIIGDAKSTLAAINKKLDGLNFPQFREIHPALQDARTEYRNALYTKVGATKPWMDVMRETLPRDTILSCDMSLFWADMLGIFPIYEPRTMLFPWGFGTLGFGVPEALGAKIGKPDQPVVAICGDGAFLFTGTELATAIQYDLNIPIIIPNNDAYGMIKVQQRDQFDEQFMSVDLNNPDFVALAHAFGAYGEKVTNPGEFRMALSSALQADKPTVIEIPWRWTWGKEQ
jgi:acetolactate synthase-1/2/3 large subunit